MSEKKRINDDAHFKKAHDYAVELAEWLDTYGRDPLGDKEEIKRVSAKYNRTIELLQEYNRGRWVQADPSRAKYYESLQLPYQVFQS